VVRCGGFAQPVFELGEELLDLGFRSGEYFGQVRRAGRAGSTDGRARTAAGLV